MKSQKNKTAFFLLVSFLLGSISVFAQQSNNNDCERIPVRITLLHVNDVYQFVPVQGGTRGGLARLMTLRKQAVKENPNTLFLMGGDTVSPSVESITYKGAQMIDAWNTVGLDYAVLGNHEFDFGAEVLQQRMKESKFVWLGANVLDKTTGKIFANTPPFVIREFGGVKVGIIGLVLPETQTTSKPGANVQFTGFCETAKRIVPEIRKQGANVVVGLTHLSMAEDKELARCAEFDLILGGHEHTLLQSSSNGTPIFKMTADAREMGKFNLNINRQTGKLESLDWEIIPVNQSIPDAPEFAAITDKYKDLIAKLSVKVGETGVRLNALSEDNRQRETNVGNFVGDAFRAATGADAALVNGGSVRADLNFEPGVLTERDVLSILPFGNEVVKIEISGAVLRQALEHGVARSAEDNEPGRFPQVSGIRYAFDASKPAGSRITEVSINGKPLEGQRTYTLALTKYIQEGGDGYEVFKNAKILTPPGQARKDNEILRAAIAAAKTPITPQVEGRIRRLDTKRDESSLNCPTVK
ncbi:MAG: bifunctional metallophosphatase/5'-nucleotidase [Acidobacteriota bacterium]|nr:bifunctional metallophosphatase/5'-nucleotidase [Acidobacteriota bacterium]